MLDEADRHLQSWSYWDTASGGVFWDSGRHTVGAQAGTQLGNRRAHSWGTGRNTVRAQAGTQLGHRRAHSWGIGRNTVGAQVGTQLGHRQATQVGAQEGTQ